MFKWISVLLVALGVGVLAPPAAQASVSCTTMSCVNSHLSAYSHDILILQAKVTKLRARNAALLACATEFPVTRYTANDQYTIPYNAGSNPSTNPYGQYFNEYSWYSQAFHVFDQTAINDSVGHWFVQDTCSTAVFNRPPPP